MMNKTSLVALVMLLSSVIAFADAKGPDPAARVKAVLGPDLTIKAVVNTPVPGLKGVVLAGGDIIYVSADGKTFIAGRMFDESRRNLTELQSKPYTRVDFAKLPLADAFKRVRGNGSRTLVTFEDVHCGYCKKLSQSLEQIDNVTVYTFLVAIMSPDSKILGDQIWCSQNQSEAWIHWSLSGTKPTGKTCDTPLERNTKLMTELGGRGTPFMILRSGETIPGYLPPEVLKERLL